MRTIHVLRAGRNYFIDGIFWGDDEEGVITSLRDKGITPDEITKALQGWHRQGDISSSKRKSRSLSSDCEDLTAASGTLDD